MVGKTFRPLITLVRALRFWWRRSGTTQRFLILASAITIGPMTLLAIVVNAELKDSKIRALASASSVHFRTAAEPLLAFDRLTEAVPAELEQELDRWFASHPAGTLEAAHLWLQDGTIAYSTSKPMVGKVYENDHLAIAYANTIIAHLEYSGHWQDHHGAAPAPLLEVYIPLHSAAGNVVAVGEVYLHAEEFVQELRRDGYKIWALISIATLSMMMLSFFVVNRIGSVVASQQLQLRRRLTRSNDLARHNAHLRQIAVQTRNDAIDTNERLLNQIGSDLHDGPLQLLSLLVLQLNSTGRSSVEDPDEAARRTSQNIELATDVIRDLRNLSYGLILPELDALNVEETLRLAILRHENITGTKVEAAFTGLDQLRSIDPILKICLYRAVQESLTNAYRHAGGEDQQVVARVEHKHIEVEISDSGPKQKQAKPAEKTAGIGMLGLSRRVAGVDGQMSVELRPGGGTRVRVRLPLTASTQRSGSVLGKNGV